ncbi:MAG: outer membrane protein assembly factor BamA [Alphaproteobacteria bacterium]|nr:outer membrane protein assembly factor BamA [Alphaproteobacteria bacterium]PHY00121.1 MAG: outer membrane protein assembly factor BamA [Rhodospirillaceae bacterium]
MPVLGALLFLLFGSPAFAQSSDVISGLAVQGNQRIEGATIRSYLAVAEGDAFDPARIDRSIKNLFSTGLFADVSVGRQGDLLVVRVVENPIINRISVEGNKRIEDDKITPEIQLRPRVVYTRTKVQQDVEKILELYRRKGRFGVRVDPKVIELPQNRVDLVYEVTEGKPTYVRKIDFIGNKEFSDGDLRDVVLTVEEKWWKFLTSNDTYDPERMNFDRELLRRHYLQNGYADFEVISGVAELAPNRESFFMTFTVKEGQRYKLGKVDADVKLKGFDKARLEPDILTLPGEWYNAKKIDDTINKINDAVGNAGYAFIDVNPRLNRDEKTRTIDLTYEVEEGPRVFVERVEVKGNVVTLDKVIRREILLAEGDAFNTAKIRRSKERLENLGFFKEDKVKVENIPSQVSPDRTVITAEVEEQSTGELQFGIGFSSASGALFDVGVSQRNLLGRGQDLRFNFSLAQQQTQIQISFTEPYFLGRRILAGGDLFAQEQDYQDQAGYTSKSVGGTARLGFNYNEYLVQRFSYNLTWTKLTGISAFSSPYIREQEGSTVTSQVSQSISLNRLNNVIEPSRGYYVSLSTDLAGLGGSEKYVRGGLSAGWYYQPFDGWVLGVLGNSGYLVGIGDDIKVYQRYQLGGTNLRGYNDFGVSPRDSSTGDALGGDWIATGTAELKIPLGLPKEIGITPKLFTDWGAIGSPQDLIGRLTAAELVNIQRSSQFRGSAGIGVQWESPVGPIQIDWSPFVFNAQPFDDRQKFRVNFGQRF